MAAPKQISNNLMAEEEILYDYHSIFAKDMPGVVFTNKRLIFYKPKIFGIELKDYSWHDLHNVNMSEGLVNGKIKFELVGDHDIEYENVPKDHVRKMYSLAKEMKEKAHLSSRSVIVQQTPSAQQEDPVQKLKQLKEMLDAGLVSQEEFDKTKASILSRM